MSEESLDLVTIGQVVVEHGRRLREDVDAGRLDHVDEALAARAEALRRLADHVAALPRPLDDEIEEVLRSLREDDRVLQEWMSLEKQQVGRAIASIKGRVGDPYEESSPATAAFDARR